MARSEQGTLANIKQFFIPLTTVKSIRIIIILGIIVFANTLFNGFVWDDITFILKNPQEHQFNISLLLGQNMFNQGSFYRPIPAIYFAALYSIFNESPFFYHILQIMLQITNTVLLFLFFKRFFSIKISLFLVLIFLVHPMQVESVSYIASSGNPLSFLFGISALLLSLKSHSNWKREAAIFSLLLLSALTKEIGILFISIILLGKVIFQKKGYLLSVLCSCAVLLIYSILRFLTFGIKYAPESYLPMVQLTLIQRLINIPKIISFYLSTSIFPYKLIVSQNWIVTKIDFKNFYSPLLIDIIFLLSILVLGIYVYKRSLKQFRIFIIFFIWLVLGLGTVSQILPLEMTVADRWFYFPLVGLLGIVGVGAQIIQLHNKKIHLTVIIALITFLCIISVRTIIRNTNWYDDITLASHDSMIQDDYQKELGISAEFSSIGQYDQALDHIKKSVALYPYYENLNSLGMLYKLEGERQLSEEAFLQAISGKVKPPLTHQVYLNYAQLLALYGDPNKAAVLIKTLLANNIPSYQPYFWELLAISEYRIHNKPEAYLDAQRSNQLLNNQVTFSILTIIQQGKPLAPDVLKSLETY